MNACVCHSGSVCGVGCAKGRHHGGCPRDCGHGCIGTHHCPLHDAALDMLKALKMVSKMAVAWQPLTPGDIAEVRAAIAKAEGRDR